MLVKMFPSYFEHNSSLHPPRCVYKCVFAEKKEEEISCFPFPVSVMSVSINVWGRAAVV